MIAQSGQTGTLVAVNNALARLDQVSVDVTGNGTRRAFTTRSSGRVEVVHSLLGAGGVPGSFSTILTRLDNTGTFRAAATMIRTAQAPPANASTCIGAYNSQFTALDGSCQ